MILSQFSHMLITYFISTSFPHWKWIVFQFVVRVLVMKSLMCGDSHAWCFAQRQSSKLLPTSGNSSSCDRRLYYTYIIHIYIYNITCAVTTDIEVYGCDQHFQWSPADHSKRLSPNFSNAGCHLPQKMYAIYFECNSRPIWSSMPIKCQTRKQD